MNVDSIQDVNENMADAFSRFADHLSDGAVASFDDVVAIATGIPIPLFNPVFVFEPPSDDGALRDAVSWMRERSVPFRVTVADTAVDAVASPLETLGLEGTDEPQPGMVRVSLDGDTPVPNDVRIEEVTDQAGLDAMAAVTAAAFQMPLDLAQDTLPPSIIGDDHLCALLGRVDDEPVACGLLVRSGDVAGVYSIAVLPDRRRRGYGEAMTWAVLRAGRAHGATIGALQSSPMGFSVYERMGFETVVEYHTFRPESRDPASTGPASA